MSHPVLIYHKLLFPQDRWDYKVRNLKQIKSIVYDGYFWTMGLTINNAKPYVLQSLVHGGDQNACMDAPY